MTVCQNCREPIEQPATGRPRKWCSERCRKQGSTRTPALRLDDVEPVSPAACELLERLAFAPDDPRGVAGLLLRQLAAALDADPGHVGLAREIRQLLAFLGGVNGQMPGEVDEAKVDFLMRRLRGMS